jgi:phage terminase large subunit-like protein
MNELGDILAFQEVGFDPWNATQISLDLAGDGFNMVPIRQGFASLSPPTKELERQIVGKELIHGGNPVLRWMAENVMVVTDAAGNVKPAKNKSKEKIDGIAALITAMARATCRQESGRSVYEQRGIRRA